MHNYVYVHMRLKHIMNRKYMDQWLCGPAATCAYTVFPRIIAGDDYFFFRTERGRLFEGRRLFEGGDYFKYFSEEVVP